MVSLNIIVITYHNTQYVPIIYSVYIYIFIAIGIERTILIILLSYEQL